MANSEASHGWYHSDLGKLLVLQENEKQTHSAADNEQRLRLTTGIFFAILTGKPRTWTSYMRSKPGHSIGQYLKSFDPETEQFKVRISIDCHKVLTGSEEA